MIHPLFTVDMFRRLYAFSKVLNIIEAVRSIYQSVQYFIKSKKCVLNFAAVTYSLHKCSETKL